MMAGEPRTAKEWALYGEAKRKLRAAMDRYGFKVEDLGKQFQKLMKEEGRMTNEPWPTEEDLTMILLATAGENMTPSAQRLDRNIIGRLVAEVRRLRAALWDCYVVAGEDTDGQAECPPIGRMTPDVPELAVIAVRRLRDDYDEA